MRSAGSVAFPDGSVVTRHARHKRKPFYSDPGRSLPGRSGGGLRFASEEAVSDRGADVRALTAVVSFSLACARSDQTDRISPSGGGSPLRARHWSHAF